MQNGRMPIFPRFSNYVAKLAGKPATFVAACISVVLWAITGPLFAFSSDWQMVINTGTTIITFLMVFVIQDSQNRDTAALHLKLDELIRATGSARNEMLDLDHLSQDELDRLRARYAKLAAASSPHPIERAAELAIEEACAQSDPGENAVAHCPQK